MQHSSRNIQTDRNYKQPSGKKSVHGGFRLVNSRQQYISHSYDKRTDDVSKPLASLAVPSQLLFVSGFTC